MSHQIKCYPLGNADTSLVLLENGKRILFDFANTKTEDEDDKRIDLPTELNKDVPNDYDVVIFTHADEDHVKGLSEYFYLQHDTKFQKGDRKKINDLWVPAAILLQDDVDISHDDGKLLKKEAWYRLKNKKGIKVFSNPEKLKSALAVEGVSFNEVQHLIINAGQLVPDWDLNNDGIEFFVHSPFSEHYDHKDFDRNDACLILQLVFNNIPKTKAIFGADAKWYSWNDIIEVTKHYKREVRLEWDFFHISHHSSYLSLSEKKGEKATTPTEQIKWLFETQSKNGCLLVSPSYEIPNDYNGEDKQPPHKQAANYYERIAETKNGDFKVTMEFPSVENPSTIVLEIDNSGIRIIKSVISAPYINNKPPRAGKNGI